MSYKNLAWFTIGNTPSTSGDFTVSTAVDSLHVTLGASDDGLSFSARIFEAGVGSEVRTGCTYTHSGTTLSRGTLESSTSGSALDFTSAAQVQLLGLTAVSAASVELPLIAGPNANTSLQAGRAYVVDAASLTATRTYTLPATAKAGERVQIMLSSGSSSYEVIITAAAGDTLNGVAGGTEWSRLFIAGEVITLRCVADSATWVLDRDGRIAQAGRMALNANITTSSAGWNATDFNSTLVERGCIVSTSGTGTSTIKVRRSGVYSISGSMLTVNNMADQEAFGWACTANGNVGTGVILCAFSTNRASGAFQGGTSGVTVASSNAGDLLQHSFYVASTVNAGLRGLDYASWMAVVEVL